MKRICIILLSLLLTLCTAIAENSFDDLGYYGEKDMWPISQNGKWGFIDHTGGVIIPCEWEAALMVVDGLAPVQRDGKWGVITRAGHLIVPCEWDSVTVCEYGGYTMEQNGLAGAMADDGTILIPCDAYTYVGPAIGGVRQVCRDDLWGLCDTQGNVITPCRWESVGYFRDRLACVRSGEGYGYIDPAGEVVIPCQYASADDFCHGSAVVQLPNMGGYQLIDVTGAYLCDAPWEHIELYSENRLLMAEKDGKTGYINRMGQPVLPPVYDKAQEFSEGLALVMQGEAAFWIDEDGTKVIDRPAGHRASPFREGMAALIDENGLSGLLDKSGRFITPCRWENWLTYAFGSDLNIALVQKDGQAGFINRQGELISRRMYPVGSVRYGFDGDYLFLLEEGVLSIWHADGTKVK